MGIIENIKGIIGANHPTWECDETDIDAKRELLRAHKLNNNLKYLQAVATNNKNAVLYKDWVREDNDKLSVLRAPNPADIAYRKRQMADFAGKLREKCKDLPMFFHGSPIYNAEKILRSGEIKPSNFADRVFVTCPESVSFSVNYYANMREFCMPAGALFAVMPKQGESVDYIKQCQKMNGVNFQTNPEQLCAVITTPENVANIADLARTNAPKTTVCDYDAFIRGL